MRLTERKTGYPNCDKKGNLAQVDYIEIKDKKLAEEKLCQLEDIEGEIGIDLITLFKALKNGFYTKNAHYTGYGMGISIEKKCLWNEEWQDEIYYFKDYGKTWALTKEELL